MLNKFLWTGHKFTSERYFCQPDFGSFTKTTESVKKKKRDKIKRDRIKNKETKLSMFTEINYTRLVFKMILLTPKKNLKREHLLIL